MPPQKFDLTLDVETYITSLRTIRERGPLPFSPLIPPRISQTSVNGVIRRIISVRCEESAVEIGSPFNSIDFSPKGVESIRQISSPCHYSVMRLAASVPRVIDGSMDTTRLPPDRWLDLLVKEGRVGGSSTCLCDANKRCTGSRGGRARVHTKHAPGEQTRESLMRILG